MSFKRRVVAYFSCYFPYFHPAKEVPLPELFTKQGHVSRNWRRLTGRLHTHTHTQTSRASFCMCTSGIQFCVWTFQTRGLQKPWAIAAGAAILLPSRGSSLVSCCCGYNHFLKALGHTLQQMREAPVSSCSQTLSCISGALIFIFRLTCWQLPVWLWASLFLLYLRHWKKVC